MRYLVLLYGDERGLPEPGSPEFDADMEAYAAFDELAGGAIVAGEALQDNSTCRTVRHDGGAVSVTDGPFAETVEGLGGYFVMEAPTLDDMIELARHIPAVNDGGVEIRPMVQWFDRGGEVPAVPGSARYLATIHGPEDAGDEPGTAAWEEGAARHGAFLEACRDAICAGGAVDLAATATTVRVRDGELLVTDGPYSEAMEVVGGFYLLRGTPDGVLEVATRIPTHPRGAVEARLVMELDG